MTERDKTFSGKFDLEVLEVTLNGYAAEGWRLAESFVAANLAKSAKAEIVLILERSTAHADDSSEEMQTTVAEAPATRVDSVTG